VGGVGSAGGPELAKPGAVLAASAEHGITLGGIESVSPQAQPRSYPRCWTSWTSRSLRWRSSVNATASFPIRDRINFQCDHRIARQDPAPSSGVLLFWSSPSRQRQGAFPAPLVNLTQNRSIPRHPSYLSRQFMQIAFTLYMIVLFPGGAPVVTNVGTWQKASDCGTAADGEFVRKNTPGEQVPSISFVCVPRSGFGMRGMPIQR